ncbi:lytic transglycosylase domain-containing protein [Thermospira aquatica]|uniref:Lytic transglycosylase domain-containing protein n=1 Tax=Thermospira aquatica TaxID=2828656 RepID=A0AAX3BBJ9_9SPIR|nr:lytic transglycosylase domain-containing protein [Thermospira aquatica]URA09667.1 lytic transglycosylase domain-containing protein [Thermospira aquatica]
MIIFFLLAMTTAPLKTPSDPAALYQRGSYRQVLSLLEQSTNLSFEDQYRLAQSRLMIEGSLGAWQEALLLSVPQENPFHQFLFAFFIQKLFEKPLPPHSEDILPTLTNWLSRAHTNPYLSTNHMEMLFWNIWKISNDFMPPRELPFLVTQYTLWQRFLSEEPSTIPLILTQATLLTVCWQEFTNQLVHFSTLPEASWERLWKRLAQLPEAIVEELARKYIPSLPPSRQWKARVEYALVKKKPSQAIEEIEKALQNNLLGTIEDFQKAITWANQLRAYSLTEKLAHQGIVRFGSVFHWEYTRSLIRQNKTETLLQWYEVNEKNILNKDVALAVFGILLEKKDPRLPSWLERREKATPHPTFSLTRALLFLEHHQPQEAYPLLLGILSDAPYSYEWCVANFYASPLHAQYPSEFTNWFTHTTNTLPSLPLHKRLLTTLALYDITGQLVFPGRFSNDLKQFQESVLTSHFSLTPSQKQLYEELLALTNSLWTNYPRELAAYLDKKLETPENRYRFSWYGHALYEKADARGIALARLDYYFRRYVGRESILLMPENWQKTLYPLDPLKDILPVISNTNLALWVLSAYRQESHFRKDVISSAGAYGYAQLMPATASQLARNLGIPGASPYDYDDNVFLGNNFYLYLFRRYGWIPYALAAYNAGEGAVNTWKKRYPFRSPLWIEMIPYQETRNYVKIIWQKTFFYRRIYQQEFASLPFTLD